MDDRVDVLAFDERAPLSDGDLKHRQTLSIATWVVVAAVLAVGLLEGIVLLAAAASAFVLGAHALLFADERPVETTYRTVEAGRGVDVVRAHETEVRKRGQMRTALLAIVVAVVLGYSLIQGSLLAGILAGGLVGGVGYVFGQRGEDDLVPRLVEEDVDRERATRRFDVVEHEHRSSRSQDRQRE